MTNTISIALLENNSTATDDQVLELIEDCRAYGIIHLWIERVLDHDDKPTVTLLGEYSDIKRTEGMNVNAIIVRYPSLPTP